MLKIDVLRMWISAGSSRLRGPRRFVIGSALLLAGAAAAGCGLEAADPAAMKNEPRRDLVAPVDADALVGAASLVAGGPPRP